MNALAIDCATARLGIAAQKGTSLIHLSLVTGTNQAEKLLPAIDAVLHELSLAPAELDFTAVTSGPGSFTSLRLGFSTLKALTLSHGIPLYGIPTLDAAAWPFRKSTEAVLSVLEAKSGEFFYAPFLREQKLSEPEQQNVEAILKTLDPEADVTVCGPGATAFLKAVSQCTPLYALHSLGHQTDSAETLLSMGADRHAGHKPPLADYDGPNYFRKSEAERQHEARQHN